jgi:hypothetical protein
MTPAGMLADPRVRLGAGGAALLLTAVAVHRDRVGPGEAAIFRVVNGLPGSMYRPAWAVMQLGALGAAPVTAGAAWLAGDRELAGGAALGVVVDAALTLAGNAWRAKHPRRTSRRVVTLGAARGCTEARSVLDRLGSGIGGLPRGRGAAAAERPLFRGPPPVDGARAAGQRRIRHPII